MKKLIPIFLLILFTLTGCFSSIYDDIENTPDPDLPAPQSVEELYSLYSAVEQGMTKAELTERYGEPTPADYKGEIMYYKYFNETKSAGVAVYFNDNDKVTGKTLFYNNKSNLIPFSGRYSYDKLSNLKEDMTIEAAIAEMGSHPLEVSCTYGTDGPESAKNIYVWYNEDGSTLMINTDNGVIESIIRYE
ncbi:MAG: hypothetical protein IKM21_03185 [Oscillospiraceae bacterium]|nr:hypothetical protein [Oscillospiraceae bacterium]